MAGILRRLLVFSLAFLCWAMDARAGSSSNRACDIEGILTKQDTGVLYRTNPPGFSYNQAFYPIATYSVWRRVGDKFCLRYEVENLSEKPIYQFYWETLDRTAFVRLRPHQRLKNEIEVPATQPDPVAIDSDIRAFEGITPTTTQIYRPVQEVSEIPVSPGFALIDSAKTYPAFLNAMQTAGADLTMAYGFSLADKPTDLGTVDRNLTLDGGTFHAASSANFDGKYITVRTSLGFQTTDNQSVQIFAPALLAMQKANSPEQFAELISEFQKVAIEPDQDIKVEFAAGRTPSSFQAFVITQPVTIQIDGKSTCLDVSSYSPFPISVGKKFCN